MPTGTKLLIRKACNATLKFEGLEGDFEVDVTLVKDETIREINLEHRNIDSATDVLSFPLGEDGVYDINPASGAKMLGDIVISVEHAKAQAEEYGHTFQREMAFLTVHSMLHLLGYDHVDDAEGEKLMFGKQKDILERMNITRES